MAGIEECKALCDDKKFMQALDQARGQVGSEVRSAQDGAGQDVTRRNRDLGVIISKDGKGGYKVSRVSTNILNARECVGNNGLVCNFIDIKDDPDAVAVLIGVPPGTRLESFNSVHFMNTYKRLAIRTQKPVFVMGTGANAIRTYHVTDGQSVTRVK